ncbi:mucin-5AC-like [Hyla sarda]|uniref:mucin-5AC-like n=1 Tax=Hyla sarda TaxID=327740 RepID=UPI0024C3A068|nr:mucin-5AC-like [Hyla sarda]
MQREYLAGPGGQKKLSEEDWDSVDQEYGEMNIDDIDSAEEQQLVGDDDEDVQQQSDGSPSRVNIIASPAPVYRSLNPSHNQRICSTFGNHHYKTFDGDIFHFRGNCTYQFVRHCKTNYEEFFVGITRHVRKNVPVISGINMKLDGADITVAEKTVIVNSVKVEELPFSVGGTQISKSGTYIRISSKIGFEMFWNEEDSITLELSQKYVNQTCGLCGDYNGIPIHNEFMINNAHLTNVQYGNLQKYHNPEEQHCEDTSEEAEITCPHSKQLCTTVLTGTAFQECNKIVEVQKYIELCEQDICRCTGNSTGFCLCNIFTEYSRQCTHAGGKPKNWRTSKICPLKCAFNLQFKECGTACPDTCSNPDRSLVCDDHCTDGCFCPAGLVFDDIRKTGCIAKEECPCTYNGDVYPSGKGYAEKCQDCTCEGGKWNCVKKQCFGVCALEGGSHVTTFDATRYNFHGDCTYTLSKTSDSSLFSVLAELSKCGHTDTETCLKSISLSLNGGKEFIFVKKCGSVYINSVYTQLPVSTATATIFKPTSFFVIIQTNFGIQAKVQLVPTMQVYVSADPKWMDKTSGLCGNFNDVQADDFKSPAGVLEGTGSSFGNLWKTQLDCPNVKNNFEDPCALIGQNELYASHNCDMLLKSDGPFGSCHKTVDPESYHKNCMFDACNCEKKEDCMCSALSSYVSACARQGVDLRGWRTNICHSYTTTCLPGQTYRYTVSTCTPSCRALSEHDVTCEYDIGTIDGCTCEDGTYRDDNGKCVLPALCSCYYKGTAMSPGEVIHENGAMCTCTNGKLDCVGIVPVVVKECEHPMVYFDCDNATAGAKGSECQKSCSTFDSDCYSSGCVSGCVCPEGLVLDDERNICIREDDCPCRLNDDYYAAGETVQVKCNTCTCKRKKWECTTNTCLGTCAVYGDGHYQTFDNRRYRFNGNCWYTLTQDYCSKDPHDGTFRVFTENTRCGTQGTTCSKTIRLFLGNYELILGDQKFDVVKRNHGTYVPFKVRQMGIYLVVEAANGLVLVWDKKTTIFVKLDPKFEGKVCGLCGNFDGNAANDFVTRSQSKVGDVAEFGNSWKLSERCPNAVEIADTCASNPYRKAWSQKQCSIITSSVFASCHGVVDPVNYYDACVNDACACDAGGDCDCFCTAVAAYAQACSEAGQCISWRTPNICPVFCDFYNQQGHCEWHYKACGAPCMKTCMNPTGVCFNKLPGLEGCYPTCPEDRPFFDEESMHCVASCHCYDEYGEEYKPGEKMPGPSRCSVCTCSKNGRQCTQAQGCCEYEGKEFLPGDIVYYTADGIGGCLNAICSENSTIERMIGLCPTTTAPPTTFDFSPSSEEHTHSTPPTSHGISPTSSISTESSPSTSSGGQSTEKPITSKSESSTASTPSCVEAHDCTWSQWYDVNKPENSEGDFERFEDIESKGHKVCKNPKNVECRAKEYPNRPLKDLKQEVTCSRRTGLVCLNSENPTLCYNYEIRIECCKYRECTKTPSSTSKEQPSSPTSSSVDIKTQPPTPKEHPTSLPVQSASQTSTSTSATPQQPETTKTPSTSFSGTPETSSPVTGKTTSSEESTNTPTPPETTTCVFKMECRWTPWYDLNSPSGRSDGGDIENVEDIESAGNDVCTNQEVKNNVECEAVDDKGLTVSDNSQKFSCDVNDGLICNNRDQNNKEKCKNYKMRIECCRKVCETIQTPEVTTTEITEPETTGGETTTQGKTPSTPLSTGRPSSEVTSLPTTLCVYKKQCRWTKWFDNNNPSAESDGGDTESIEDIESTGREVCGSREVKERIECEAVDANGVPTENNNQIFSCNLKDGLGCKNTEQKNNDKCDNYQMRVLCCEEVCEPVFTPTISTPQTSEPTTHETSTTKLPEPGSASISSTKKPGYKTPSEGTSPPSSSSSSTSSEVITSSTSTTCKYKTDCRWTNWFDINRPSTKSDGGESENPDEIKSLGHEMCKGPETEHKIECEAIDSNGVTIANNDQILTCVLGSGLTCSNRDQKKKAKCHNYRIRVHCCATYCEPVVTPTRSSLVSTKSPTPTTSSITEPTLSSPKDCENERAVECRWTKWLNNNQPSTAVNGEERENSYNSRSLGSEVCKPGEVENQIECKAEQYSESSFKQNRAQKTICNLKDGLICRNQDQSGDNCHDYSIRIECCSENFVKSCGESTTSSTEATSIPTTISVTKSSRSETSPPSTSITGTSPGTTSGTSTEVPSSSSSSEVTSATSSPTPGCIKKMECHWTSWHDNNAPNPKGDGGDTEKAQDITDKGLEICSKHEVKNNIECEGMDKTGAAVAENKQTFACDMENGLSCLNKNQKKKEKCYNYRIRFECCAEYCEKVETTTLATTSSTTETTTETSSTEVETITSGSLTESSSTEVQSTPPGSLTESSSTEVQSTPPGSSESSSPIDTKSPTSSIGVTSSPKTTSSTTKTESSAPAPVKTTSCEKLRKSECHWTGWQNKNEPSLGTSGEEIENSEQLKSEGIEVCKSEEVENTIECQAAEYTQVSSEDIEQNTICNVKDGFVCKNSEQTGEIKQCLDYEIRFECCSKRFIEFCGKTPSPTSPSSSEATESPSTTSITEPLSPGDSTPGQTRTEGSLTSEETSTSERPDKTNRPPGTPPIGTTVGKTPSPGRPSSEEPSTSERPEKTPRPPGTPPRGTTPGEPTSSEEPERTPGQPGTPPRGSTPGRTPSPTSPSSQEPTSSERPEKTPQPPGTPSKGSTPEKNPSPGSPSSEEPSTPEKTEKTPRPPGTPPSGSTPGELTTSEEPERTPRPPGTPPRGSTPGKTPSTSSPSSEEPSTPGTPEKTPRPPAIPDRGSTPGEPTTSGEPGRTSQPPGTPPRGSTPGKTPSTSSPSSEEPSTPGRPEKTPQPPGTPPKGSTSGEPTTSEEPEKTSRPPGTPPRGSTPGKTPSTNSPSSEEPSTPGRPENTPRPPGTPPRGSTPGEPTTSGEPGRTSQPPGTPPRGSTPGKTPSTSSPSSEEPSTSERPEKTPRPPGTPPKGSTPGEPTTSEEPERTSRPPGTPPRGSTPGEPTTSEEPERTPRPPGTPPRGSTPGKTPSTSSPSSEEPSTPERPEKTPRTPGTPPRGSTPGELTTSEEPEKTPPPPGTPPRGSTPGEPKTSEEPERTPRPPGTPPKGSTPGEPTTSEEPERTPRPPGTPPRGSTPGKTPSPGSPSSEEPSTPGRPEKTPRPPGTPPKGSTSGEPTTSEEPERTPQPPGTPPRGSTPVKTPSTSSPSSEEPSTSGRPEKTPRPSGTPPKGSTPGEPTTSEEPERTSQPPGTPPRGSTPGKTPSTSSPSSEEPSTPERPEKTPRPPGTPPRGTTSGELTTSEEPEKTPRPPGTPPRGSTPGEPKTSEEPERTPRPPGTPPKESTPGEPKTSEEPERTPRPPGTPPRGSTPGKTPSTSSPSSEEPSTPERPEKTPRPPGTPPKGSTPGEPTTSEEPGRTPRPPGTPPRGSTPGEPKTSEEPEKTPQPPGTPPRGSTPGEPKTSEEPERTPRPPGTPPKGSTPGEPTTSEEPERTPRPPGTPPRGSTPGKTPSTSSPSSEEPSTPGRPEKTPQPPGTPPRGSTSGEPTTSEEPGRTPRPPGTPPRGSTPGEPKTSEEPEKTPQPPGTPPRGSTPGEPKTSEEPERTPRPPGTPPKGSTPGEPTTSEEPERTPRPPVTPPRGSTPGKTPSTSSPSSEEPSTPGRPEKTPQPPGTPPRGSTSGEPTTSEEPERTPRPPGTPPRGSTPGKTPSPGSPSSEEPSTPGRPEKTPRPPGTPPRGTTSGEPKTSEEPERTPRPPGTPSKGSTSGEPTTSEEPERTPRPPGTPPSGSTPGKTPSPGSPSSEEPSTSGRPEKTPRPPGTPPRGTTSGEPKTSEEPERTPRPPGTPPKGSTPGEPTTSEEPERTPRPPGTPPRGSTPGKTPSTSSPSSEEPSTPGRPEKTPRPPGTPPRGSTPGEPTTTEEPGRTPQPPGTPPRGSTPGEPKTSEEPERTPRPPGTPPRGSTPGKTPSPGSPSSEESSTPGRPEKTPRPPGTPPKGSTSGEPTTSEEPERTPRPPGTPPRGSTPGKTPSPGSPSSEEPSTPGRPEKTPRPPGTPPRGTTSGEPTTSEEPERTPRPPGTPPRGSTPERTPSPGSPISEEPSTPEKPEKTPQSTGTPPRGTTPGEPTTSEEPERTPQPPGTPPRGTTPGESLTPSSEEPSTPERPDKKTSQPPSTPPRETTPEETEEPSRPPGTPPRGTTPGEPTTSERPEQTSQPPGTPPKGTSPNEPSTSNEPDKTSSQPGTSGEISPTKTLVTSTSVSSTASSPVTVTSTSGTTAHPTGYLPFTTSSATPSGSTVVLTTTVTPEQNTPSSEAPTTHSSPTTACLCKVKEDFFTPGEYIYSRRDHQGCPFHAVCGATCEIEWSTGECFSTEIPSTSQENIKDTNSEKPKISRPSRRPPTSPHSHGTTHEPGTTPEPGTSHEYSTSTESTCGPCECVMPNCGTGYRVVSVMPPGACCANITCEPDSVCVSDNTIYKPGSIIPQSKNICQKCECSKDDKDESGFYAVKCEELLCDKTCQKGFEYAEKEGKCCGECVPKQCTMKKQKVESGENVESGQKVESGENAESGQKTESGESGEKDTQILIQIGDTYRPEGSSCIYYECDEEDGKPVLTKVKKVCQELDVSKCEEGSVKYDEDGCCRTCTPKTVEKPVLENCSSRKNMTVLKEGDCEVEVELTHCGGPCMGTSIYSTESQGMDHKCSCCTELEVAERQVEMLCANGRRLTHYYKDVVKCGCSVATCEPLTSAEFQESQQQRSQVASRRRRR